MDDWDSVSSDTPLDGATDAWEAVSEPQQPAAPALPFPTRSERIVISSSTGASAFPSTSTPSRHKQIIKDSLALLSTILFFVFIPLFSLDFSIYFLHIPVLLPLLWALSYVIGICIAAVSGRKGLDALFPVLIGCTIGFVIVVILITSLYFYHLIDDVYFLLLLLGAATYAIIQSRRFNFKRLIYFLFCFIEGIILLRFLLRLSGANPMNLVAGSVYALTDFILFPSFGIFPSVSLHPLQAFEVSTLLAMIIYGTIFWAILRWRGMSVLGRKR
jgi:hypothetical protein